MLRIVGKVCAGSAGAQKVCKKALKHILILQCGRPLPWWTNPKMRGSLRVRDGRHWDGTTHSVTHLLYRDQLTRLWLRGDDSVMASVKRLSGVAGFGPSTFAFLRGKLSSIISNRGPWNHKGLAVSASPHPGPIIFAGEERPTSEVPNYADARGKDAPADNRCLSP